MRKRGEDDEEEKKEEGGGGIPDRGEPPAPIGAAPPVVTAGLAESLPAGPAVVQAVSEAESGRGL